MGLLGKASCQLALIDLCHPDCSASRPLNDEDCFVVDQVLFTNLAEMCKLPAITPRSY